MDLLLIKIGKAWSALRADGLRRGSARIIRALFKSFRRVGSGDILFIASGVGMSAEYRCHHTAEELRLHGFRTSVTVQDNPLLVGYADKFSVFVFHRTLVTPSVAKLIEAIKLQGKEIIFETDDLVYDPKYLEHMDYYKKMNPLERKLYENGVGGEIVRDPYVTTCTTTTSYLADKLRECGKRVIIVPNRMKAEDMAISEEVLAQGLDKFGGESAVSIGYFSGTPSHNKDFATIVPALLAILERYPETRLVLVGPLDTDDALQRFADRVDVLSFVPWKEHLTNVSRVTINVAALEIGNPFCESKSAIKYLEAGLMRVPTVASATQAFCDAIEDGVDGFTAATTEEWVAKLSQLIESPELRATMADRARAKVLADYTVAHARNEEYYEYLRSKM